MKRTRSLTAAGLILCFGLATSLLSQAEPVTFLVKGSLTGFGGPQLAPFEIGQSYEAQYTFESETRGEPILPGNYGFKYPALISSEFKIGDYEGSLRSTDGSFVRVFTDGSFLYTYTVVLDDVLGNPITTPAGEIVPPSELIPIAYSIYPGPLPSPELPLVPFPIIDVVSVGWRLTFQSNDFLGDVYGDVSVFEVVPNSLNISIDIKPGSDTNSINPRSNGVIPVVVLGSQEFDATQVDSSKIAFGPDSAQPVHDGHVEDVDCNGFPDVVFHFGTRGTGISCGDTEAELVGSTFSGDAIIGVDLLKTVSCQ